MARVHLRGTPGPNSAWMASFVENLTVHLHDSWDWRERSQQTITPQAEHLVLIETEYQFRLQPCLNEAVSGTNDWQASQNAPQHRGQLPHQWRQIIPVARLRKQVPHRFELRDGSGAALPRLSRFDGARLSSEFLFTHWNDAIGPQQENPLLEYHFLLLCFVAPQETQQAMARFGADFATFDEALHDLGKVVAWIRNAAKPHVQNDLSEAELMRRLKAPLTQLFRKQAALAAKVATAAPNLLDSALVFQDALFNPLMLVRDNCKMNHRKETPFEDAVQAVRYLVATNDQLHDLVLEAMGPGTSDGIGLLWELRINTDGWVAYTEMDVTADEPFVVRTELLMDARDTEQETAFPARGLSWHLYPIAYGDCRSTHIDIISPHPELVMPCDARKPERCVQVQVQGQADYVPVGDHFGHVRLSEERAHLYTTRRFPRDGTGQPTENPVPPIVTLAAPFKALRPIAWTYRAIALLCLVLLGFAGFTVWSIADATMASHRADANNDADAVAAAGAAIAAGFDSLLIVMLGGIALLILFATVRHPHKMVGAMLHRWMTAIIWLTSLAAGSILVAAALWLALR